MNLNLCIFFICLQILGIKANDAMYMKYNDCEIKCDGNVYYDSCIDECISQASQSYPRSHSAYDQDIEPDYTYTNHKPYDDHRARESIVKQRPQYIEGDDLPRKIHYAEHDEISRKPHYAEHDEIPRKSHYAEHDEIPQKPHYAESRKSKYLKQDETPHDSEYHDHDNILKPKNKFLYYAMTPMPRQKQRTNSKSNKAQDHSSVKKRTKQGDDEDNAKYNDQNCGLRMANFNVKQSITQKIADNHIRNYVIGGQDADENEFPWQVSIQIFAAKKNKSGHFCGGAIIKKKWVITAAHCLDSLKGNESTISIKAGAISLNNLKYPNYPIEKFIIHEGWNKDTQADDLALVKIKDKFTYKINKKYQYEINSVCLPTKNYQADGNLILTGFGQKTYSGDDDKEGKDEPQSDILQKITVPYFDRKQCAKNYIEFVKINEEKLCAGGKGGQDSCMGDSGGPLIQSIKSRFQILGVVSFGYPCAVKDMPGVYTKISKYIDWINKNTADA